MIKHESIEQYEDWTGATYVEMRADGSMQPVKLSSEDRQRRLQQIGQRYVADIQHALQMKADYIDCGCADKEVVDWVKDQFTPEEWKHVHLTFWDVPIPREIKKLG